jgi:hypothetical protein
VTLTRAETNALSSIREGRPGIAQPLGLRRRLRHLESVGLVRFSTTDGWLLTEAGREAIAAKGRR